MHLNISVVLSVGLCVCMHAACELVNLTFTLKYLPVCWILLVGGVFCSVKYNYAFTICHIIYYSCMFVTVMWCLCDYTVYLLLFISEESPTWNDALHRREKKMCRFTSRASISVQFCNRVHWKNSKNRWNGFTHHNKNPSFKQRWERSGFPGKTYQPLRTTFTVRLSSTATCWALPWLHVFVCTMGGPRGNQTHNHSLALQIKKCIYTY